MKEQNIIREKTQYVILSEIVANEKLLHPTLKITNINDFLLQIKDRSNRTNVFIVDDINPNGILLYLYTHKNKLVQLSYLPNEGIQSITDKEIQDLF